MKSFTCLNKGLSILSPVIFVIIWQIISTFYNSVLVPTPLETIQALIRLISSGRLLQYAGYTIWRGLIGFIVSLLMGIPLGLFMGLFRPLRRFLQPIVVTIQVVPVISWLVLAMIWFGFDRVPIFVVVITTLPIVILNIVQGVLNVDPQLTEMARMFKVSQPDLIFEVYLPQVLPYLFAAMSTALGTTWKAVVMAEFLSAQKGIGAGMSLARINLETGEVFAWTFLLVSLGLLTDHGLQMINKRLAGWRVSR